MDQQISTVPSPGGVLLFFDPESQKQCPVVSNILGDAVSTPF
jgi:hypothetical protein